MAEVQGAKQRPTPFHRMTVLLQSPQYPNFNPKTNPYSQFNKAVCLLHSFLISAKLSATITLHGSEVSLQF